MERVIKYERQSMDLTWVTRNYLENFQLKLNEAYFAKGAQEVT